MTAGTMSHARDATVVVLVLACGLIGASDITAAVTFSIVAKTGDTAPGTEPGMVLSDFGILGPPGLNGSGQAVFRAFIINPVDNSSHGYGIWSDRSGSLELVVRTGDSAPGTEPGVTFAGVTDQVLNDAGQMMFTGILQGPGVTSTNRIGIWSDASGSLQLVAREGDQAPGLAPGAVFRNIRSPVFNEAGQTAFHSGLTDPNVSNPFDQAVWSERNGTLALVARAGDIAPNTEPGTVFLGLSNPLLNDLGQTTFKATLTGPDVLGSNLLGIWSEGSGALGLVARSGNQAPGTDTGVVYRFDNSTNISINNAGHTAFTSLLAGPGVESTNDRGVWADASGAMTLITRTGEQAPLTPLGVVFTNLTDPLISARGQTAIFGELTGPRVDSMNDSGIWVVVNGTLKRFVRAGQGGMGVLNASFSEFTDLVMAPDTHSEFLGSIAVMASIFGPSIDDTNNQAIFMAGDGSAIELVVREGNPFDVNEDPVIDDIRTIGSIEALFSSNGQDGLPTSLNTNSEIAFMLNFTDGSSGIIVAKSGILGDIKGDLNDDGFVGIDDLNIILSNWNQNVSPGNPQQGDTNGDGYVSIIDLNYVLPYWNEGAPPASGSSVPEPGTGLLLLLGLPWVFHRVRRGRNPLIPAPELRTAPPRATYIPR